MTTPVTAALLYDLVACPHRVTMDLYAVPWRYIQERQPCTIFYYSKYERTIYRALQEKYPGVCSARDVEQLFDTGRAIDLYYDVVKKSTEWPTSDFSVRPLAEYLGFSWRDTHPSGTASIERFHRWIESADPVIQQRILDYNEDDCRATRILRDTLENLPVIAGGLG
jgi:predicted RecB family nuclease